MADAELETIWARLVASRCCPLGMVDDKPGIYALFLGAGARLPGLAAGAGLLAAPALPTGSQGAP